MLTFLKLNGISALYALVFFIQAELMINVYRIERITGWKDANKYINVTILLVYVVFTILCYFLTKHLLGKQWIKYVITVLWIPYCIVYLRIFASLYPMTNPGESPLPGIGLVLIAISIIFPFYIAFINFLTTIRTGNV